MAYNSIAGVESGKGGNDMMVRFKMGCCFSLVGLLGRWTMLAAIAFALCLPLCSAYHAYRLSRFRLILEINVAYWVH